MRLTIHVRDLQPGDVLVGSKQRVLSICRRGHLPGGKRQVTLLRGSALVKGTTRTAVWNAGTTVTVEREQPRHQPVESRPTSCRG